MESNQHTENLFEKTESSDFDKLLSTVVEFFRKAKVVVKENLLLLFVFLFIGAVVSVYKLLTIERFYVASIMFMLQDEDASGTTMVNPADPLSAFMLSRTTSQTINIDKLKEISMSQKVITNVLFSKCIIRGKEDFLINHYLVIYNGLNESYFKNYRGLNGLNRNQYRVFFASLRNIKLYNISIEEQKSTAFNLKITTTDEELSKVMCEIYYQNLSNFYIDKTTEKAQRNYVFLRNRLDSVRNMLYATEYQVANFEDRSQNLLLLTARVPQARQIRNTEFYKTIYLETLKSFESSKVTLNNITPIFQVLSRPYYPLYSERQSRMFIAFIGMLITFVLMTIVVGVLYFRKYNWPHYKELIYQDYPSPEIPEINQSSNSNS